jgi:hypothetical protein
LDGLGCGGVVAGAGLGGVTLGAFPAGAVAGAWAAGAIAGACGFLRSGMPLGSAGVVVVVVAEEPEAGVAVLAVGAGRPTC